jgi:hypothetical protein
MGQIREQERDHYNLKKKSKIKKNNIAQFPIH